MTTSVTEEPTIAAAPQDAARSHADEPVRGRRGVASRHAAPTPACRRTSTRSRCPSASRDMWRLAQKTYRAERRYYLKLERHRPMTARRLAASILSQARAARLHHRRRPFGDDLPGRLPRPHPGDHLPPRATGHQGRRPLRLRAPLGLPPLALVLPARLQLAGARGARRRPALQREDAHQHLPHPVPVASLPRLAVHPHHPRRPRRGLLAHAQALAACRGRLVGRARAGRLPPRAVAQVLGRARAARGVPAHQRCPAHGLGLAALHGDRPGGGPRAGRRSATTSCATSRSCATPLDEGERILDFLGIDAHRPRATAS